MAEKNGGGKQIGKQQKNDGKKICTTNMNGRKQYGDKNPNILWKSIMVEKKTRERCK